MKIEMELKDRSIIALVCVNEVNGLLTIKTTSGDISMRLGDSVTLNTSKRKYTLELTEQEDG